MIKIWYNLYNDISANDISISIILLLIKIITKLFYLKKCTMYAYLSCSHELLQHVNLILQEK